MSSFMCEKCRAVISDSPNGYTTGCEHHPQESRARAEANYKAGLQRIQKRDRTAALQSSTAIPSTAPFLPKGVGQEGTVAAAASIEGTNEAWENRALGNDERYVAPYEDTDHKISRLEYMVEILEMQAIDLRRELAETKESNAELGKDLAWQKQYAMRWEKAATVAMKELAAERAEGEEQARLLGISGSREARLLAELVELDHCRQEAERAEMLAKEVEALKVDAERYRWLREQIYVDQQVQHLRIQNVFIQRGGKFTTELDAAIDAARGEK